MYCSSISLLCGSVQALPKQTTVEWRVRKKVEGEMGEQQHGWMEIHGGERVIQRERVCMESSREGTAEMRRHSMFAWV